MEEERSLNRFFLVLGCCLGILAILGSLLTWSWWPLATLGIVLFCVAVLSLSEATIFSSLLSLVLRAGERKENRKDDPDSKPDPEAKHPVRRPGT
jgi:membrane protein implicated in regulation of membrane protease activity